MSHRPNPGKARSDAAKVSSKKWLEMLGLKYFMLVLVVVGRAL